MREDGSVSPRRVWLWVLSRPVFRAVDFYSSYASAWRSRIGGTRTDTGPLEALDARKRELHLELAALSESHGDACAACEGGCCREERFRDSFVDRLMTHPAPRNTAPRSLRSAHREEHLHYAPLRSGLPSTPGYCPNCSPKGCELPAEDRPIQCLAYQCRATISTLSDSELDSGIRAIKDLMRVMIEAARVPAR